MSLKPDLFEGLRFDLTKPLNHNFALSHSIFMGNIDVPTANPSQVKTGLQLLPAAPGACCAKFRLANLPLLLSGASMQLVVCCSCLTSLLSACPCWLPATACRL